MDEMEWKGQVYRRMNSGQRVCDMGSTERATYARELVRDAKNGDLGALNALWKFTKYPDWPTVTESAYYAAKREYNLASGKDEFYSIPAEHRG